MATVLILLEKSNLGGSNFNVGQILCVRFPFYVLWGTKAIYSYDLFSTHKFQMAAVFIIYKKNLDPPSRYVTF